MGFLTTALFISILLLLPVLLSPQGFGRSCSEHTNLSLWKVWEYRLWYSVIFFLHISLGCSPVYLISPQMPLQSVWLIPRPWVGLISHLKRFFSCLHSFYSKPSFPSASFSLSLSILLPCFPLSPFSQHHQNPLNFILAPTPASAAGHFGPHPCLTADSSFVWIQRKSSLWKTMHTLFLFFSKQEWVLLCHAKCSTWLKIS